MSLLTTEILHKLPPLYQDYSLKETDMLSNGKCFAVAFCRLEDFTSEVLRQGITSVNFYPCIRNEGVWRHHLLILTARAGNAILVCQISVDGQAMDSDDRYLVHYDNLVAAIGLVRDYLAKRGLAIQSGVYVLDYRSLVTAGADLWRFDDGRLVPHQTHTGEENVNANLLSV